MTRLGAVNASGSPADERSDELLRALASKSLIGVFVVQEGRFVYLNPRFETSTGYSASDLIGQDCFTLVVDQDRERVRDCARRMLKGLLTTPYEYQVRAKDGELRSVLETVTSVTYQGRRASLGSFMDITDRKRVEDELKANLSLYSATVESTADCILVVDRTGRIVSFNSRFVTIWGLPEEILEARDDARALAFVLDQLTEPERFIEKVRELYATPEAESFDVLDLRDGKVYERHSRPQRIEGETIGRVWSFRDVSERRREEQQRALLSAVVEATTDMVFISNLEGDGVYVNAAGRRLLGIAPDLRVQGDVMVEHMPEWAKRRLMDEALPTVRRDGAWSGELAYTDPCGSEIPVSQVIVAHGSDASVQHYSAIARDISEQKRLQVRLSELADRDPLTGLFNRRRFQDELQTRLDEPSSRESGHALLILDVDQFKDVNDSLGHAVGDEVLVALAAVLAAEIRPDEVIARLGGDEFAILVPLADEAASLRVAERLLDALRGHTFQAEDHLLSLTASIGIALFPKHGETTRELFSHADQALYGAKENGRDRATAYSSSKRRLHEVHARLEWRNRIRQAVEGNRLLLYAQPVISVKTGDFAAFELLLRMRPENGRIIPAESFVKIAERFGLIRAIDRWVVREAIQFLAESAYAGHQFAVAVNLSVKAFDDGELVELIRRELAQRDAPAGQLVLEVTETAAISNIAKAQRFINAVKTMGCRFALDDFGAGFSSFYHLKHLRVDYLKIDGGFIRGLARNEVDRELVKAMVGVAHALRIETVAEFVGDQDTMQLLRQLGVDYAQGFFLGRPCPLAEAMQRYAA
jgi:diguanylate cyclase (GGDEF)-like protein/PAS domain S-box-containing protein